MQGRICSMGIGNGRLGSVHNSIQGVLVDDFNRPIRKCSHLATGAEKLGLSHVRRRSGRGKPVWYQSAGGQDRRYRLPLGYAGSQSIWMFLDWITFSPGRSNTVSNSGYAFVNHYWISGSADDLLDFLP